MLQGHLTVLKVTVTVCLPLAVCRTPTLAVLKLRGNAGGKALPHFSYLTPFERAKDKNRGLRETPSVL